MLDVTKNKILNGNIVLYQPKIGFRIGIDSILLSSSVNNYKNCLDLGSGIGVIMLSLAKRFPKSRILGVEKNKELIKISKENVILNNLEDFNIEFFCTDIKKGKFLPELNNSFDRVVMNPPYFFNSKVVSSSDVYKKEAKYDENILTWFNVAYSKLKSKGYLNFIFRSEYINIALECLSNKWGDIRIFPLWPKIGKTSKLTIIQARKNSKSGVQLMPGLVLHNNDGTYTETCNKILNNKSYIHID